MLARHLATFSNPRLLVHAMVFALPAILQSGCESAEKKAAEQREAVRGVNQRVDDLEKQNSDYRDRVRLERLQGENDLLKLVARARDASAADKADLERQIESVRARLRKLDEIEALTTKNAADIGTLQSDAARKQAILAELARRLEEIDRKYADYRQPGGQN